jgi:hypothetical protein
MLICQSLIGLESRNEQTLVRISATSIFFLFSLKTPSREFMVIERHVSINMVTRGTYLLAGIPYGSGSGSFRNCPSIFFSFIRYCFLYKWPNGTQREYDRIKFH